MKVYDYIFFRFVKISEELTPQYPVFSSIVILCWLALFNSITLIYIISVFENGIEKFYKGEYGILLVVIILFVHFVYFLYGNYYQSIIEKYSKKKESFLSFYSVVFILYIISSIGLCFLWAIPNF